MAFNCGRPIFMPKKVRPPFAPIPLRTTSPMTFYKKLSLSEIHECKKNGIPYRGEDLHTWKRHHL